MTAPDKAARLYTPEILGLAVELTDYPIDESHTRTAEVRSRSCGSSLLMAVAAEDDGAIRSLGLRVSACAIGQAAAAIFARSATGRARADISDVAKAIETWLAAGGPPPKWPGITALEQARAYPARHEAILLPWRAAIAALSNAETDG